MVTPPGACRGAVWRMGRREWVDGVDGGYVMGSGVDEWMEETRMVVGARQMEMRKWGKDNDSCE